MLRKFCRKPFHVYGLLFVLIAVNAQLSPSRMQLQTTQWSYPQTIPEYDMETWPPILIADENRTVHAFSSQWIDQGGGEPLRVVFYNTWTLEQGWTIPVDIIISPNKEARITDAHLDKNGIFHIVFFGGDSTAADMYYSKAPAALAGSAHNWSEPTIIGRKAGDPEAGVFVEDDQGRLHVVYSGRERGTGLYVAASTDRGETWSDPTLIFFTLADAPNLAHLHVIKDQSGWLHAVWGVYSIGGQGRGIYYSRSRDGNEWSEPALLATARDELGTQTPTIIEYNKALFAIYNMPPKITMRQSIDNGGTWSDPFELFPRHVGVNGSLAPVIDGNNVLHLFFGQRIPGDPDIHGMWHGIYQSGRWLEPDAIIKGPLVRDTVNQKGFDPYQTRAVVSQGNTFLVTWRTDPLAGPNGVWYSYKMVNAPELPLATFPPAASSNGNRDSLADSPVEGTAVTTPSSALRSECNVATQIANDRPISQSNPSRSILVGSISALILVLIFVTFYGLNRSK